MITVMSLVASISGSDVRPVLPGPLTAISRQPQIVENAIFQGPRAFPIAPRTLVLNLACWKIAIVRERLTGMPAARLIALQTGC